METPAGDEDSDEWSVVEEDCGESTAESMEQHKRRKAREEEALAQTRGKHERGDSR